MEVCPNCLGNKEVFNGEDYDTCKYCKGTGKVTKEKYNNYNPMENLNFLEDDIEDT